MTTQLIYTGRSALASAFVQMLEDEGLVVTWTQPEERRGWSDIPQDVVVNLLVTGVTASVIAGVKAAKEKFQRRFPGQGDVRDSDQTGEHEDRSGEV